MARRMAQVQEQARKQENENARLLLQLSKLHKAQEEFEGSFRYFIFWVSIIVQRNGSIHGNVRWLAQLLAVVPHSLKHNALSARVHIINNKATIKSYNRYLTAFSRRRAEPTRARGDR
jgi:hypothetical protein